MKFWTKVALHFTWLFVVWCALIVSLYPEIPDELPDVEVSIIDLQTNGKALVKLAGVHFTGPVVVRNVGNVLFHRIVVTNSGYSIGGAAVTLHSNSMRFFNPIFADNISFQRTMTVKNVHWEGFENLRIQGMTNTIE